MSTVHYQTEKQQNIIIIIRYPICLQYIIKLKHNKISSSALQQHQISNMSTVHYQTEKQQNIIISIISSMRYPICLQYIIKLKNNKISSSALQQHQISNMSTVHYQTEKQQNIIISISSSIRYPICLQYIIKLKNNKISSSALAAASDIQYVYSTLSN